MKLIEPNHLNEMKEQVQNIYDEYNKRKETAEQNQFPLFFFADDLLEKGYYDLQKNWNDDHAEIFVRSVRNFLNKL